MENPCAVCKSCQYGMVTPYLTKEEFTKFLGNDDWKKLPQHNRGDFFRGVLDLYKQQLDHLGFAFTGRVVLIRT